MSQLTERHQRFYSPGWARFASGKQPDLGDRFLANVAGGLTSDPAQALVVDADAEPVLVAQFSARFEREFFSTALQRWV